VGRLLGRVGLRGAIAIGLIFLVAAVVAIGKLSGNRTDSNPYVPVLEPTSTVDPTSGDDAEVVATPTAYPDDAVVRSAATTFTQAWLRSSLSEQAWHAGLAKLSTKALSDSLDGVDPKGVPATRRTGEPTIVLRSELFAQATIPTDAGTLKLTLLKQGSDWLVDAIDWDPA
jgi:hypothetical protein